MSESDIGGVEFQEIQERLRQLRGRVGELRGRL
jgi:hypothetical protein